MVYAVAISPDGRIVACGGWLKKMQPESIYIFNRGSGRILHQIVGLPDVINHLVFLKNGRFLAAALGGGNGLRVFRTSDYSLAAEDRAYGGKSTSVDFDSAGRLVTTSYDGLLRLYDASFHLVAKRKALGGEHPYAARFSLDGSKIAVGFEDSIQVNVVSGEDLSPLISPDMTSVNNGTHLTQMFDTS